MPCGTIIATPFRSRPPSPARSACRSGAEAESNYRHGHVQGKHRQRHNSSAISISPSLDLRSWREFRAVLVSKEQQAKNKAYQLRANASNSPYWCHRLPRIEPGCLILANQAGMGFYEKAVILVVSHTSQQSIGLMLNRAAGVRIEDLAVEKDIHRLFGHRLLRLGGCMNHDSLHIFHADSDVANSHEVCPGMYTGGLQSAVSRMGNGLTDPSRCALICGSMRWAQGQLDEEIAKGTWLPVSASPELVIDISCNDERSRNAWHDVLGMTSEPDRV